MATPEDMSYTLQLIDAYIDQIEDWEAEGKYDKDIKDFFGFLREYKANIGDAVNIVKAATGLAPNQIRNKGDAEKIRELLRRTLTSEALTRRRSPDKHSSGDWAIDNVAFGFDQQDKDPKDDKKYR